MNGHCFAHGDFEGIHCPRCHGGATLDEALRRVSQLERKLARCIDPEWAWQGDEECPGRYIAQLADALWRHEYAENFLTVAALCQAARAVGGDAEARKDLDTNPGWVLEDAGWRVGSAERVRFWGGDDWLAREREERKTEIRCVDTGTCDCVSPYECNKAAPEDDPLKVYAIASCPTPVYHETHRYCPSCPWTEADG